MNRKVIFLLLILFLLVLIGAITRLVPIPGLGGGSSPPKTEVTQGEAATSPPEEGETDSAESSQPSEPGSITVETKTDPAGKATDSFTFTGAVSGTISAGQPFTMGGLQPGTYTSQETESSGWNLASIKCDDANSSGNVNTKTATFQLKAGEIVKCTFNHNNHLPKHGLWYAFVLPFLFVGLPWLVLEIFIVRYVQPRSADVAEVLIKAQDGLFLEASVSMTGRRKLSVASTRMTWPRVRDFVEKTIEQELIHEATKFPTIEELERKLKTISDSFKDLTIAKTLSVDFGVEILWFNIEIKFPQETMDALQRKAHATAGGTAYLAFAIAAHLDPNTSECRELYKVFEETSGQVDAARNLGGGIANLADYLTQGQRGDGQDDNANND